jgi:DNA topoisomerase-1
MPDQNINIGRSIEFFASKRFREYKEEEVQVSKAVHLSWSCFCVFAKRRKPLDIDFERAKELIDEKAIADAPVAFYKGGCSEKCCRFGPFINGTVYL